MKGGEGGEKRKKVGREEGTEKRERNEEREMEKKWKGGGRKGE